MRNIIFIVILLLVTSCNTDTHENKEVVKKNTKSSVENFKKSMVEEKFMELYDLNTLFLKNKRTIYWHIERRIKRFSTNSELILLIQSDSIRVKNIRHDRSLIKLSDSVEMTKIYFDLVSEKETKTDSILAFITSKKMMIDSEEVLTCKVKFAREILREN